MAGQLCGNCGEESRGVAALPLTSFEKEAGSQLLVVGEGPGNCTSNCRLSHSCRAIQPEYWLAVFVVCPAVYVTQ